MVNKKWIRITEDTFDFSEGEVFRVIRRENDGLVVSRPDNLFDMDWVDDGIYEYLKDSPYK